MRLTVLVDNNTMIDRYYIGEPGVSYLLEEGETKILFDVGYSDVFMRNALKMNVSLDEIDYLALSHGHNDHTWGLSHFVQWLSERDDAKTPTLVAHPLDFKSKRVETVGEIGTLLSSEVLERRFAMLLSRKPVWLTERCVFLGEIKRRNDFENQSPLGSIELEEGCVPDFSLDDSALVYKGDDGLVIVTGCSHSGICNIVSQAVEVCKESRIQDIIGGLHLLDCEATMLDKTCDFLRQAGVKKLHAAHCTDLAAKIRLAQDLKIGEVGVGLCLEYK